MSRGPGAVQRQILDSLAAAPARCGVFLTWPGDPPAQASALRRAAHRLAELGRVRLDWRTHDGRRHLTAWRP